MKKYAILMNKGHNRVYFETSRKLAINEMDIIFSKENFGIQDIKEELIEGIYYITFKTEQILNDKMELAIARLSFIYALFEIIGSENEVLFKPVKIFDDTFLNSNISSLLKYSGKTNEIFTRMLMNIAVYSNDFGTENLNILDPVAGKGTTLYESLIYGNNAYGIEISDKYCEETFAYMKKFLENEKYKHVTHKENVRFDGAKGVKYSISMGRNRDEMKNSPKTWNMVYGNSKGADKFYKKELFHAIVGDLPYGVKHSNRVLQSKEGFTRSPKELIENCAGSWRNVLKKGGVLVLSWNSFLMSKTEFAKILNDKGFAVLEEPMYQDFEHRVDQAIKRDIIVAKKI